MTEQSFENLKVWQKAHQLMLDIHKRLIPLLPKEEKYDLADQVRRSSKSVAATGVAVQKLLAGFITWIMSVFVITQEVHWTKH